MQIAMNNIKVHMNLLISIYYNSCQNGSFFVYNGFKIDYNENEKLSV